MDNEIIEDAKKLYTIPNIVLFEYYDNRCSMKVVYQETCKGDFVEKTGTRNGRRYKIKSVGNFQVTYETLFMKGGEDFSQNISRTENVDESCGKFWESVLNGLKDFKAIHSMEELEKYKVVVDGGDEEEKIDFSFKGEPNEEEINKMISLVDLPTFCKIIQNRLDMERKGFFDSDGFDIATSEDIGTIINEWAKKYLIDWAKAKYRFYKIFGDKLSIEKEIEHIPTTADAEILKSTLKSNFPLYAPIISCMPINIIRDNKMSLGGYDSYFNYIKDVQKMTFTKFMSLYGNPELDNEISKLYQANGKTNLTISINPIDYLTVSINQSNWKSCHNFFDGCYGVAGLSLMFDKTSLVGFSSKGMVNYNQYYKKFTWNNKMWREMIYVSEENSAIVFSRQYPFQDERFSKELRKLMEEQISKYFNADDKWFCVSDNKKYINVITDCQLLYNDVGQGYSYKAVVNKQDINRKQITCTIGKQIKHISQINSKYNINDGGDKIW